METNIEEDIKEIKKELAELNKLVSKLLEQNNSPIDELLPHKFPH